MRRRDAEPCLNIEKKFVVWIIQLVLAGQICEKFHFEAKSTACTAHTVIWYITRKFGTEAMLCVVSKSGSVSVHHKSNSVAQINSISISQTFKRRFCNRLQVLSLKCCGFVYNTSLDFPFIVLPLVTHWQNIGKMASSCSFVPFGLPPPLPLLFLLLPLLLLLLPLCIAFRPTLGTPCEWTHVVVRNVFHWFVISVAFNSITNTHCEVFAKLLCIDSDIGIKRLVYRINTLECSFSVVNVL